MFESDFHEVIEEYRKNAYKNPHYIFEYIKNHPEYSVIEIATITGADPNRIRRIFKDLGRTFKTTKRTYKKQKYMTRDLPPIERPLNWRDPEWLDRATRLMGARKIARLVNVTHQTVTRVINKLGLRDNVKHRINPKHQFKNHAWLHYHYHILHYSRNKCAKIANVSSRTMYEWFSQMKIAPRKRIYKLPQRVLWFEKCFDSYKNSRYFKYVRIYDHKIRLTLPNNKVIQLLYEKPDQGSKRENDLILEPRTYFDPDRIPSLLPRYRSLAIDAKKSCNIYDGISRAVYNRCSQVERLIAKWKFRDHIKKYYNLSSEFTDDFLKCKINDLYKLKDEIGSSVWLASTIFTKQLYHPINYICLHFNKPKHLLLFSKYIDNIKAIIDSLIHKTDLDIDYYGYSMAYLRYGRQDIGFKNIPNENVCPILLSNYIKSLDLKNEIIDLSPNVDKAMALHFLNKRYNFINNRHFNMAISGIASITKILDININIMSDWTDGSILLDPPLGLKGDNLKIKVIDRKNYRKYDRLHKIYRCDPFGYANNLQTVRRVVLLYS